MKERVEKELYKIERLEREIGMGLREIEYSNSFIMILIYGLLLGILSNLAAAVIYEVLIRDLEYSWQWTVIGIILVAIPLMLVLIVKEFRKIKKARELFNLHLERINKSKK